MVTQTEIIDGKIKITKTPVQVIEIETLTRKDIVGKRAEAQTIVDHLNNDKTEIEIKIGVAEAEVAKLDVYLVDIDKIVEVE